jgi:hypothetical protein
MMLSIDEGTAAPTTTSSQIIFTFADNKVKYGFKYPGSDTVGVIQQHRDTHKAWFKGKDRKANIAWIKHIH